MFFINEGISMLTGQPSIHEGLTQSRHACLEQSLLFGESLIDLLAAAVAAVVGSQLVHHTAFNRTALFRFH